MEEKTSAIKFIKELKKEKTTIKKQTNETLFCFLPSKDQLNIMYLKILSWV